MIRKYDGGECWKPWFLYQVPEYVKRCALRDFCAAWSVAWTNLFEPPYGVPELKDEYCEISGDFGIQQRDCCEVDDYQIRLYDIDGYINLGSRLTIRFGKDTHICKSTGGSYYLVIPDFDISSPQNIKTWGPVLCAELIGVAKAYKVNLSKLYVSDSNDK
jgi:hypothetical protein